MARTSAAPRDGAEPAPHSQDGPARAIAGRPGRPRNASYDKKILDAAEELLIENGYAGFTIEGVAARTGVGRPTIYRRWPSKAALAIAALEEGVPLDSTPDTGSLREDLRAFQHDRAARINLPATRPIVSGLASHAVADPALAAAFIGWYRHRLAGVDVILQRAIHRGELPADVDFELVNDLLLGPLYTRAVVRGQPLAPELADQTADTVLAALHAGGLRTGKKGK
jgi:AcrR family transcriptional regulator